MVGALMLATIGYVIGRADSGDVVDLLTQLDEFL
jgi:hypothetical protein